MSGEGSSRESVELSLSPDAALVLFDLLHRFEETDKFDLRDAAETKALWALSGALERVLVDPFKPDYNELVQAARDRISATS